MTQQTTLFTRGAPVAPDPSDPDSDQLPDGQHKQTPRQTPLWLIYLELSVRVVVRLYLGLVLVVLPWTPFWTSNRLLLLVPHVAVIALSGITRGLVSGLGLLDIWIGIMDAIHYKQG
jgi:hypothetical protein